LAVAAALAALATIISVVLFRDDRLPLWFYAAEVVELWAGLLAGGFLRSRQMRKLVG